MDHDPRARSIGAYSLAALFVIGGAAGLLRAWRGDASPRHLVLSLIAMGLGLLIATAALRPRGPRSP